MAHLSAYIADNKKQANTMAVKIEKAAIAVVEKGKNDKCNCRNQKNDYYDRRKRKIVATSVEKKVMATDVIKEKGKVMDNATIKEKEKVMDIDAIKEEKEIRDDKEKSKDVFQQKCEDLNLDCIHDNSLLGFEKPMPLGFKMMESQDPLEEINMGTEIEL